jgi:diguanylate cyclase (GGDEF)-like protein/PAS domain S-box-containing protein
MIDNRETMGGGMEQAPSEKGKGCQMAPAMMHLLPLPFVVLRPKNQGAKGPVSLVVDYANVAYAALLDQTPEQVEGTVFAPFAQDGQGEAQLEACRAVADGRTPTAKWVFSVNGRPYPVTAYRPEPGRCALLFQDISPDQRAEVWEERVDGLTGLLGRVAFFQEVQKRILSDPGIRHVMIQMDVERFRMVNELFGQDEGDRLLRYLGETLRLLLREEGLCGRIGGDVFSICMPYTKQGVQNLMSFVQDRLSAYPLDFRVQVCFGLCLVEDVQVPAETLCDRAGLAMKTVKGTDTKRYAFFDETLRQSRTEEREMAGEMEGALLDGQFTVYLQPKYDLETGSILGAEALVRWCHPQKGTILPEAFLPLFERNGFMLQLEPYLWEQVCKLLRTQLDQTGRALPVSINVSRLQLYNPNLCRTLLRLVERYGLDPALLELELDARGGNTRPEQLLSTARALRESGFPVLLDQFLNGGLSLALLKDLPASGWKIDLRRLEGEEKAKSRGGRILVSLLRMAQWLNVSVTVQGVETKWQAVFLKSIGCTHVQGFHFARPMPAGQYRELVDLKVNTTAPAPACTVQDPVFGEIWTAEAPFSLLLEYAVDGAAIYEWQDGTPSLLRANQAYLTLIDGDGASLQQSGQRAWDRTPEEDRALLSALLQKAMEGGGPVAGSYRRQTETGEMQSIRAVVRCLAQGASWGLVFVSAQDVTELSALEQKSVDMAETLRSLLDALPVGIGLLELDGQEMDVAYANETYCRMHGYSKKEYIEQFEETPGLLMPEEEARRLLELCHKAFRSGHVLIDTYQSQRRDGTPLALSLRVAPFPGQMGKRIFCAALMPRPGILDGSPLPAQEKEQAAPAEPEQKEKGRRRHRKTALSALLMEQPPLPAAEAPGEESTLPAPGRVLEPEQTKEALAAAVADAPAGSVSALFAIEYEEEPAEGAEVLIQETLERVFPAGGVVGRISPKLYLVFRQGAAASDARARAEEMCAVSAAGQEGVPACSIGIVYAAAPMPPLSRLLEQAMEAIYYAKALGENKYAEYAGKA